MAVYQVINGKVSPLPNKCYGVTEGKTVSGLKLYRVKDGKSWKYWERFGTEENPYKISKPEDLKMIAQDPDGYYLLTKDIVIPGDSQKITDFYKDTSQATELLPILTETPFTGTLDGQGKKIRTGFVINDRQYANRAIVISSEGKSIADEKWGDKIDDGAFGIRNKINYGFFGINRGVIKNLAISPYFSMYYPGNKQGIAGFLVGVNDGTIDTVTTKTINVMTAHDTFRSSAGYNTAGIVGVNNGTISNCKNKTGNMEQEVGCFVGVSRSLATINFGLIENCSSTIQIYMAHGEAIVARNGAGGVIRNCRWEKNKVTAYGLSPQTTRGTIEEQRG